MCLESDNQANKDSWYEDCTAAADFYIAAGGWQNSVAASAHAIGLDHCKLDTLNNGFLIAAPDWLPVRTAAGIWNGLEDVN